MTHSAVISIISKVISKMTTTTVQLQFAHPGNTLESIINQCISQQSQIGWKHLFMGRISKQWLMVQREYFKKSNVIDNQTPYGIERALQKWRRSFVSSLIQYGLDVWRERNFFVHGKTSKETRFIERNNIIRRANQLYLEGEESVPRNRRRLFGRFDKRMTESTRAIKLWIQEVEKAQEVRQKELRDMMSHQPSITSFLQEQPISRTKNDRYTSHTQKDLPISRDAWIQQDLRRLFLHAKPNVRFRHTGKHD